MKKIYFLLLFTGWSVSAQVVNFPDVNFKTILTTTICADFNDDGILDGDVDVNNDGNIDTTEVLAVVGLEITNESSDTGENILIADLTGLNSFANLKKIRFVGIFFNNQTIDLSALSLLESVDVLSTDSLTIQAINLANLSNLTQLGLSDVRPYIFVNPNIYVNVNLSGCTALETLVYSNSFMQFDFCQIPQLKNLDCQYLEGGEPENGVFDFGCLTQLETLNIDENFIEVLILKNGSLLNSIYWTYWDYIGYPSFICIDDNPTELLQIQSLPTVGPTTVINGYCNFGIGGALYALEGSQKIDSNLNGCDANDIVFPNFKFQIEDGIQNRTIVSDATGNYSTAVFAATNTITPIFENPTYFTVAPTSFTVTFPNTTNPVIQNFCITPNGSHTDLEVIIVPINRARPGFDATYKLVYKNKGNTILSGSVTFEFEDDKMDVISSIPNFSSQATGLLTYDYSDLFPFETRETLLTLNINSPQETPAVNNGNQLNFKAIINPLSGDEILFDNTSTLKQTVVGSFDPNDKTCVEGNVVGPEMIGQYVHYVIRFENTGTFPAENVVVKDMIDLSKFDLSSLIPTSSSHSFVTRIAADGKVEFIFENIQLPFDDANNDGYIAFKIKTLPSLVVGNTFTNNANIYFDYNFPIVTNTASTTIEILGNADFMFGDYLTIYPNPTQNSLNIKMNNEISITSINIYNSLGQLVLVTTNPSESIDVSNLKIGSYFVKVISDKGISTTQFIKQ